MLDKRKNVFNIFVFVVVVSYIQLISDKYNFYLSQVPSNYYFGFIFKSNCHFRLVTSFLRRLEKAVSLEFGSLLRWHHKSSVLPKVLVSVKAPIGMLQRKVCISWIVPISFWSDTILLPIKLQKLLQVSKTV